MQQQISVVTLGIVDLATSRRFYVDGFGWTPVFENEEVAFYQMNGLMLGTWLRDELDADMGRAPSDGASYCALAHNVVGQAEVSATIDKLTAAGGTLIRAASAPAHGGFRGYVSDPDGHPWEIAWNPAWAIDDRGHVTFGI